jgi:hypothetical protein
MVREIRIYVEGGGKGSDTRAAVRAGFSSFLEPLRSLARERGISWDLIACGPRRVAFDKFKTALAVHPHAFNVLLVDAEAGVSRQPWEHLRHRDGWESGGATPEQCHLIVQMVEAWLVADPETLGDYYGSGFHANALPAREDVEAIEKRDLLSGLERATQKTQKGRYHKIQHCPDLLKRVRPEAVRRRSSHCERLFVTLEKVIFGQT